MILIFALITFLWPCERIPDRHHFRQGGFTLVYGSGSGVHHGREGSVSVRLLPNFLVDQETEN